MPEATATTSSVLLIEADSAEADRLASLLNENRLTPAFRVAIARTLPQALVTLAQEPFDVVLLGLPTGAASPRDSVQQLQRAAALPPLIVLNGTSEDTARAILQLGADDYLSKTEVDGRSLTRAVRHALERAHARAQLEYQASLVRYAHDAIITTNAAYAIQSWNPAAERIYGWPAAEVLGRPLAEVVRSEYPTVPRDEIIRVVQETGHWQGEVIHHNRNGAALNIQASVTALRDAGGRLVEYLAFNRDITARRAAEAQVALQSAALTAAANAIVITDPDGTIEWVNPAFTRLTGYLPEEALGRNPRALLKSGQHNRAFYQKLWDTILAGQMWRGEMINRAKDGSLYAEEQTITPLRGHDGAIAHFIAIKQDITARKHAEAEIERLARFPQENPNPMLRLAAGGQVLYANRASQTLLDNWGCAVGQPAPAEVVGWCTEALADQRGQEREIEIRGIVYALSVMPVPAAGYVNLYGRDVTVRRQRERELEAVAQVSAALRVATRRDEMLPVVLDQVMELLEAEGAWAALREPGSGEIVITVGRGLGAGYVGTRLAPGEGISGWVTATGQPFSTPDAHAEPRIGRPEILGAAQAVAVAPLNARGVMLGALWAARPASFAPAEVRLLTTLADITANALQRAALHEQTVRRLKLLQALRSIDQAITASLDIHSTLNVVLDQALAQLSADAAAVWLLGPEGRWLDGLAARGFRSPAIRRARLPVDQGLAGQAIQARRLIGPVQISEIQDLTVADCLAGEEFATACAAPLVAKGYVHGVLCIYHRAAQPADSELLEFLETCASQAAIAVENAALFENLQRSNAELTQAYDATLLGWSRTLELRDRETEGHAQRVTELTVKMAQRLGVAETELKYIRWGAILHDIGKMGIPDAILLKPGPLTEAEWAVMRRHPVYALEALEAIAFLRPALDIPYCHHEKWDGTGYPRQLKGEAIPLSARIFAVADVWDALSVDRPYRPAWPPEKVLAYIREQSGRHFDPQIVAAFEAWAAAESRVSPERGA